MPDWVRKSTLHAKSTLLLIFDILFPLLGSTLGIGRGGLNPELFPHADGSPHPFPVFIRPEVAAVEHLTIVTPSSVEKIPEMVASVSSVSDRRESGYARQLEFKPTAVNSDFQVFI